MDIMKPIIRHISYPLWMIKDGNRDILKYINAFDDIGSLSRQKLLERQFVKLKEIILYAYNNTDYYHRLFDEVCFNASTFSDPEEIRKIPILSKDLIRDNISELKSKILPPNQVSEANTGGSTGVPLRFLRDRESLYLRKGQELFFDAWMGYDIGEKVALFVSASHFDGRIRELKAKIRNATCERMLRFDPHQITDSYLDEFLKEYLEFRPRMIKCFPNSLIVFAHFLNRRGVSVPKVRSISCTGENLYAEQRMLLEETFSGEVFEKVGTRESGVFACECSQHKGMHIFTEGVCLEIIDANGNPAKPGDIGKVVITDLFNKAMPLIRYDIGDMAVPSDGRICSCGCELPLIERLLGRDRDIIIDAEGNPKPGYLFTEVVLEMNLSAQFQIIQPDRRSLVVKIVKNESDKVNLNRVRERFLSIIGPSVDIIFDFVDEIPRDPSGKYGYVISKIKYINSNRDSQGQA